VQHARIRENGREHIVLLQRLVMAHVTRICYFEVKEQSSPRLAELRQKSVDQWIGDERNLKITGTTKYRVSHLLVCCAFSARLKANDRAVRALSHFYGLLLLWRRRVTLMLCRVIQRHLPHRRQETAWLLLRG